jgi:hypothetical protein
MGTISIQLRFIFYDAALQHGTLLLSRKKANNGLEMVNAQAPSQ